MAFTQRARYETTQVRAERQAEEMHRRGWYFTMVGKFMLRGLRIEVEEAVFDQERGHYAPVWVECLKQREDLYSKDGSIVSLLEHFRDNVEARDLLCAEVALDPEMTKGLRRAASAYVELSRQARERGNR